MRSSKTKLRTVLLGLSCFWFVANSWSQDTPLTWSDQLDVAGGDDLARDVVFGGGHVFVAGLGGGECTFPPEADTNCDFLVRAYAADTGKLLWKSDMDWASGTDAARAIAMDASRVYAAGTAGSQFFIRALGVTSVDAIGDIIWDDRVDAGGVGEARDVEVRERRAFVAGHANGDYLLRTYDSRSGELLWDDQFDRAGDFDEARAIAVHRDRVFVAGLVTNANRGTDLFVRAYRARRGDLLWESEVDIAGDDDAGVAVVARGGRVVVAGLGWNGVDTDILVQAYHAATGSLLWEHQVDKGAGWDQPRAIALGGRRVFIAGEGGPGCDAAMHPDCDFLVLAYDVQSGALVWEDQLDKDGGIDSGFAVEADHSRVVVGGSGADDFQIRIYQAATGLLLQEMRFDLAGRRDIALAMAARGLQWFAVGMGLNADSDSDLLVRAYGLPGKRGTGTLRRPRRRLRR